MNVHFVVHGRHQTHVVSAARVKCCAGGFVVVGGGGAGVEGDISMVRKVDSALVKLCKLDGGLVLTFENGVEHIGGELELVGLRHGCTGRMVWMALCGRRKWRQVRGAVGKVGLRLMCGRHDDCAVGLIRMWCEDERGGGGLAIS